MNEKSRSFVKEWVRSALLYGVSFAKFVVDHKNELKNLADESVPILLEIFELAKACEDVLPPANRSRALHDTSDMVQEAIHLKEEVQEELDLEG